MSASIRFILAAAFALFVQAGASAQAPARTDIEALRQELGRVEAQLSRPGQTDYELQTLRGRVEPIIAVVNEIIARESPRLEEINARLAEIGPKPDAKSPPESAEVAATREEQERLKKEVDETIRVTRLLLVRAEQIHGNVTDRRRALFRQAVLERTQSVASPWLWADAARALPAAADNGSALLSFRLKQAWNRLDQGRAVIAGLLVILIAVAWFPAHRLQRQLMQLPGGLPTRRQKAWHALRRTALSCATPLLVTLGVLGILELAEMSNDRLGEVIRAIILSWPILAFLRGLCAAILSPGESEWRLLPVEDTIAARLNAVIRDVVWLVIIGKIIEAINQGISAALPVTVASKGVISLLVGLTVLFSLRRVRKDAGQDKADASSLDLFARLGGWMAGISITAAALAGYVSLASFLTDQIIWIMVTGALLTLLLILVDELIGKGIGGQTGLGHQVSQLTGLTSGSVQQISILSSGLVRLVLFAAAGMLVLAPWGVDSGDMLGSLRAAFFGFQVGGVTVSLSTIAIALTLFFLALFVTRSMQSWLEGTYLPSTSLDIGLRNSIKTIFGYVGFIAALVFSLGYMGISLDKVTLVAGALSVGIGFGLQSIVNNFVSGLILLWERPIRVGDWIVVGEEQGKVKRINVRATEIETFDKASLIVPNSEFISGRVKNWMHNDRTGRIIIPVGVSYGADPEHVKQLLLDVALSHIEVLSQPAPMVLFMKLGDSSLDFELRCFVDVDAMGTTRSELLFEIFRRLKDQGIDVPFPRRTVELADIDRLGRTIAENIPRG